MERVVDRAELLSEASTPPSSPCISKITALSDFEFVSLNRVSNIDNRDAKNQHEDEDELDFQLFAPSTSKIEAAPVVAKVRLQSPEASDAEPGFTRPRKDDAYYFKEPATAVELQRYKAAALSGQEVLLGANSKWPGMSYSWKLLEIPTSRKQRLLLSSSDTVYAKLLGSAIPSKHRRPGKKARIALRMKAEAAKAKQSAAKEAAALKEAAEQEKRTRRNREKKVKKKHRDKAKKAEAVGLTPAGEDDEMAGTGSGTVLDAT